MTEHKRGLTIHENRAFVERIAWHAVGIIKVSASVDHEHHVIADDIGTGTACGWEGRKIILAAKHVVINAPKGLQFLLRVGEAVDWDHGPTGFASRVSLPIEKIIGCKDEDLAAIILKPDGLDALNVRFCEFPKQLARTRSTKNDGSLIIIGYPHDCTFKVSESKTDEFIACVPTVLTGHIAAAPENPISSSYDPDKHILIRYEPRSPDRKPFGYSGAGVWCDPAERSAPLWTAEPLLFGVQTEAFIHSRLLKAVGAPAIRKFLEESL